MLKLTKIDEKFWISGELNAFDFAQLESHGIKLVLSILPDEEADCGNNSTALEQAALRSSTRLVYLPVRASETMDEVTIDAIASILANEDGPVLLNCKSGTRAALAVAMQKAAVTPSKDLIATYDALGFDFGFLEEDFAARFSTDKARELVCA